MTDIRMETPRTVRRIEVIEVMAARGRGIEEDPVRVVTQYWSLDGKLLGEYDPTEEQETQ